MEQNTFVDRFFHSSLELTDFRKTGERDINTLFSFLNNLHSLQDRFREQFHSNISQHPEFKLLRILRNYHHHVGDVDEFRVYNVRNEFTLSHSEMIIIPLYIVAKAILNAKKRPNAEREIQSISEFIDDFEYISANDSFFRKGALSLTMVKRTIQDLIFINVFTILQISLLTFVEKFPSYHKKKCIINLDDTYTSKNNIEKRNLLCHAGEVPFLTTEGYIIPEQN